MNVTFGYTILYVSDVAATLDFFIRTFRLQPGFISDEKDYGELSTGATTLAFASHTLASSHLPQGYVAVDRSAIPVGIEIALVVADVAELHTFALSQGALYAGGEFRVGGL